MYAALSPKPLTATARPLPEVAVSATSSWRAASLVSAPSNIRVTTFVIGPELSVHAHSTDQKSLVCAFICGAPGPAREELSGRRLE